MSLFLRFSIRLNIAPLTTGGSICRTCVAGPRLLRLLLPPSPPQTVSPFHRPLVYGNRNTADGKFSHKSCHPPNKAIKMFVCIIEGNVLPWVSFKRRRGACMHNFLKIHAHLGVRLPRKAYFFVEFTCCFFFSFFFHAQVSISNSDCPCNQLGAPAFV